MARAGFLVVDMPPGTGDIQLTLSQSASERRCYRDDAAGDIALADAKSINMFQKVTFLCWSIIENMSFHLCPECGHKEHPFGTHGGSKIAERYQVPLLGALPVCTLISVKPWITVFRRSLPIQQ